MTKVRTVLGQIGFDLCGEWQQRSYGRLALVSFAGGCFVSLVDNNAALLTDATKWMVVASKGGKGDAFVWDDFTPEQLIKLKGEKGNPGKDFQILGYYDTVADLRGSVISPEPGEAYGVGTEAPYPIYIWDSVSQDWVNNGAIQGPAGSSGKSARVNSSTGYWQEYDDVTKEWTDTEYIAQYVHPSYTSRAFGLYKVTVDETGHISLVADVTKEDITALGIPRQDTVYDDSDIRAQLTNVEAIARGRSRAQVFDTVTALDAWLVVAENVASLQIGDNFYIKAVDVPDYWWDGAAKQPIEGEKVDLTNYVQKEAGKGLFSGSYDDLSGKPTTPGVATPTTDGLMSKEDKSRLDVLRKYTAAITVAALSVDAEVISVTLSTNTSLSVSATGAAYNGRTITAFVYCPAACTITIPTTGSYLSMCGSSVTVAAGKWVEFNLTCVEGVWHIAKMEQE